MSLLTCECNFFDFCNINGVEILYHASLSTLSFSEHKKLLDDILLDKKELDILCVEGNVVRGPDGTGLFDTFMGKPKKDRKLLKAHHKYGSDFRYENCFRGD